MGMRKGYGYAQGILKDFHSFSERKMPQLNKIHFTFTLHVILTLRTIIYNITGNLQRSLLNSII